MQKLAANNNKEYLGLAVGAFLISFSPVFVRIANVGPTMAGVYRNLFGAIFLLIYALVIREKFWRGLPQFILTLIIGLIFAIDLTFWHKSILYIGPGLSTILGNFQVFILTAYGVLILKEKLTWRFRIAVPVGILGLIMIFGWDWNSLDSNYQLGFILGIATAITYSFFTLSLRHSQSRTNPLSPVVNLTYISFFTTFFMAIFSLIQGESFAIPDTQSLASMLGYGIFCQALAWLIISKNLPRLRASLVGLILLLQPILAFVWDIVLFARPTSIFEISGVIIALTAIYLGSMNK